MFICTQNTSVSFDNIFNQLTLIKLVAVGDLVKTRTGYSPLLLTEEAEYEVGHDDDDDDDDTTFSKKLVKTGDKIDSVGYYYFEGVDLAEAIYHIHTVIDVPMDEIFKHLYSGTGAAVQARAEGYFFIKSALECMDSQWLEQKPLIFDGISDGDTCYLFPFDITADELAVLIKTHFCAIGGLVINDDDEPSIYFFESSDSYDNEYDFRHCMSHVINEKEIDGFCASSTYGDERQAIVKYLATIVDPSYVPGPHTNVGQNIEQYATMLAKIATKKSDELFPLSNRNPDGTMEFHTTPMSGMPCFLKVPLELQIAACAKVVGVSVEEMTNKLRACTNPEIEF